VSKQLFYLTNSQLTAYQWDRGKLSAGQAFSNDEAGWESFALYLSGLRNSRVYLLADLIEEDFQHDNLPHVQGRARQMLLQRRLGQLYRDTPYHQATLQGRQQDGRKDDQMMFSALTNAVLLRPWLDAIAQQKLPLVGIYSPALLSAALLKKLDLVSDRLLLVTHQAAGLRQSFFQGTSLKFSRLTPLLDHSPASLTQTVVAETAKTYQFLLNTRLLPRGERMQLAILAHGDELQQIQSACQDSPVLAHRFVDTAEVAPLLGLKDADSVALCDPLFLSLLGSSAAGRHYAPVDLTRLHRLWQMRIALYAMSVSTLLAGGLMWAGWNSMDIMEGQQKIDQLTVQMRSADSQYQAAARNLPHTEVSSGNMKSAVTVEQMLAQNGPTPAALVVSVSHALDGLPQIKISRLQWQASETDGAAGDPAHPAPPPTQGINGMEPPPPAALIGVPKKPFQILLLEGEVVPFQHDYRKALESLHQLTAELGKIKQLQVEVIRSPLDTRPGVKLEDKVGGQDAEAKALFTLKLVWKP
jgi:hypothetical protein